MENPKKKKITIFRQIAYFLIYPNQSYPIFVKKKTNIYPLIVLDAAAISPKSMLQNNESHAGHFRLDCNP